MNILVLNGSPRANGNTAQMVRSFREAAEQNGHTVHAVDVCKRNIRGCLACEYCHGKGQGQCVQKDDMQEIYDLLQEAEMLVLASPIYYHNMSGQLKCAIDRFYAVLYPDTPPRLKKIAMFLSSGDRDMDAGARFSFEGDFVGYSGLEDMGLYTNHDADVLDKIAAMAASL